MLASPRPPWVRYHNIVGRGAASSGGCRSWPPTATAWYSRASAHLDDAVSEITVPADHTSVQAHPAAVLEVRRILLEHLADLEGRSAESLASRPAGSLPVALRSQPPAGGYR